jgi:hypothetical protein
MKHRINPTFVQAFLQGLAHIQDTSEAVDVLMEIENAPDFYIRSEDQFAVYSALKSKVEAGAV